MKNSSITIINYATSWDWKEQPNWDSIQIAINELSRNGYRPYLYEVHTGSDEHALLISNQEDLTDKQIIEFYSKTIES
jgi:hypothetical protein